MNLVSTLWDLSADLYNVLHPKGFRGRLLEAGESLTQMESDPRSLIRWGDGETLILLGRDVYFQKANTRLQSYMKRILSDYRRGVSRFYLAVPRCYLVESRQKLKADNVLHVWKHSRLVFGSMCSRRRIYFDANMFKATALFPGHYDRIMSFWKSCRRLIVVHRNPDIPRKHFRQAGIEGIVCCVPIPAENAFDAFDDILSAILAALEEANGFSVKYDRIIVSGGPCAKALVYELAQRGYVAHDVGKFFSSEEAGVL